MEYKGKLYGKVGKTYFPLIKTAEEVDKLEKQHSQMLKVMRNNRLDFLLNGFKEDSPIVQELDEIIKVASNL